MHSDIHCRMMQRLLHDRRLLYVHSSIGRLADYNNNNNRISIAPYGRNFRGAGGRSIGSVFSKSLIEQKIFKSRLKKTVR